MSIQTSRQFGSSENMIFRPHPLAAFRCSDADDDDDDDEEEDDDVITVVYRFTEPYEEDKLKCWALLSNGRKVEADRYSEGELGCVVAHFDALHETMQTDVPIANIKDAGAVLLKPTFAAPPPKKKKAVAKNKAKAQEATNARVSEKPA